jgi:hypothetical protein
LIAWGANEFGFTSSLVLAPNFRSTSGSNRNKTSREGASDVPADKFAGQARSSLARCASSQTWLMNLDFCFGEIAWNGLRIQDALEVGHSRSEVS